ncbi:glycosyltransferase [Arthrobacter alpinus]|uniref:glycosyltransferase family protein n=1 Tax=Arthrobacter alpinus TaxID=656366 RepID=UPI0016493D9D|nr:glycosyltransferase [Arthrobacter alpinus]
MNAFPVGIFNKILTNLNRLSDITLLFRTNTFSRDFYENNIGLIFKSRKAAIFHYVVHGADKGYEPSPFFSRLWLRQQGAEVRNLADYLRSGKRFDVYSSHPLFGSLTVQTDDECTGSKWGKLEDFSSSSDMNSMLTCPNALGLVNLIQFRNFLDPSTSTAPIHNVPMPDSAISVIVDDVSSIKRANQAIESITTAASGIAFEVILIPSSSRPDLFSLLRYLEISQAEVRICHRSKFSTRGDLFNLATKMSKANRVLFMHSGHRFPVNSFSLLSRALDKNSGNIIQPLVLDSNGLIWSAGIVFPYDEPIPVPWLRGISPETAEMPPTFSPAAAQFPIMIQVPDKDAGSFFQNQMTDIWMDVDLSLRLADRFQMQVEIISDVQVIKAMNSPYEPSMQEPELSEESRISWNALGWANGFPAGSTTLSPSANIDHSAVNGVASIQMRKPELHSMTTSGLPRLRWSIKTSAPSNLLSRASYNWGDWYFAQSLSDALGRLGQIVTVDSVENRGKLSGSLDDVVLNLRGLEPILPVESAVNVTWVISHPELVTSEEVQSSQITYAASHLWAESKSQEWKANIRPLLQCTDSSRFYPLGQTGADYAKALFIGNSENRDRALVDNALRMGADLDIYGRGWEAKARPDQIQAEHVDNVDLRQLYASARVTLNDHWPNMRDWGFMSNRAFDVVASGGRLLSDKLRGLPVNLSQLMDIHYDIGLLFEDSELAIVGDHEEYESETAAATYVLTHHTFDVRARQILADVIAHKNM